MSATFAILAASRTPYLLEITAERTTWRADGVRFISERHVGLSAHPTRERQAPEVVAVTWAQPDPTKRSVRYHYVNLLQVSGLTQGLHHVQRLELDDVGKPISSSDLPEASPSSHRNQIVAGAEDPRAPQAVVDAIEELAESKRPVPNGRLDAIEKSTSKRVNLEVHHKKKPESLPDRDSYLGNSERIKAIRALLLIEAMPGWAEAEEQQFKKIVEAAVNLPTVDDFVPEGRRARAFEERWIRDWRPYFAGNLTRSEKKEAADEYTLRKERVWAAVKKLRTAIQGSGGDLARALGRLEPQDRHDLVTLLPGLIDGGAFCHEEPIEMPQGHDAMRITASYTSDRPVEHFIYSANPLNWHKLSPSGFFKDIRLVGGVRDLEDPRNQGYTATLIERVDLGDPYVSTGLNVTFFVAPRSGPIRDEFDETGNPGKSYDGRKLAEMNAGAQFVGVTYDLAPGLGDGNIDVDRGYLHVSPTPSGGSQVTSSKMVRFTPKSELENPTGAWACQLGWVDSMRQMNSWWLR
jgi:hypothetical protein